MSENIGSESFAMPIETRDEFKQRHMDELRLIAKKAQEEAETLLGYPIEGNTAALTTNLYHLIPKGYLHYEAFTSALHSYQEQLKKAEMDLANEQTETFESHFRLHVEARRSDLLRFLMRVKPINSKEFKDKLSPHLDTMLEALNELRMLEMDM